VFSFINFKDTLISLFLTCTIYTHDPERVSCYNIYCFHRLDTCYLEYRYIRNINVDLPIAFHKHANMSYDLKVTYASKQNGQIS